MNVLAGVESRIDDLRKAVKAMLPDLAESEEWSIAEGGNGAFLLEDTHIFAEVIVRDTASEGFGLFLEDKARGTEIDVWLDTAAEVVAWISGQLAR